MRRFIRHPADAPIYYALDDATGHREALVDISAGGLCFRSNEPVAPGQHIQIAIPIRNPPFEATGRVVWCRSLPEGGHEVGVQFEDLAIEFGLRMVEQACHIAEFRRTAKAQGRELSRDEAAAEWITLNGASFPYLR